MAAVKFPTFQIVISAHESADRKEPFRTGRTGMQMFCILGQIIHEQVEIQSNSYQQKQKQQLDNSTDPLDRRLIHFRLGRQFKISLEQRISVS